MKHAVKRPSLAKEIEQLKSYKGIAAAGAKAKLAELEKKYADLVAQGKEAEAHVSPDPILNVQVVEPKKGLKLFGSKKPEAAKPAAPSPEPVKAAETKKRRK
jgi:hypothetical protein